VRKPLIPLCFQAETTLSIKMYKTSTYVSRINQVIDFIDQNLDQPISLEQLAVQAAFSKFHFHRIFVAFTGESLYRFITRLRVERAASRLLTHQTSSITEIALSCGFNDSATFARAFKQHFQVPASQWRHQEKSKIHQAPLQPDLYNCLQKERHHRDLEPLKITEDVLTGLNIFYLRHTGAFQQNAELFLKLYESLMQKVEQTGLCLPSRSQTYVIYHDSAGITEDHHLRISMGMNISATDKMPKETQKLTLADGKYLQCRFKLKNDQYGKAWTTVFRDILPEHGYQPKDGYSFERYQQDCYDQQTQSTTVDICVPVIAL
jgi:AraC family transcriptional regulator